MTLTIETLAETGSTNADLIARLARGGAVREGHWLRAERQSGGRGRLGRSWESPAGNLHCSTVVHLAPGDPPAPTLALVAGLAVHDALSGLVSGTCGEVSPFMLKWPNDTLVGNAKIAGILLERRDDAVVVGIGINVAHAPKLPDRETISLERVAGAGRADAALVLECLADSFLARLAEWRTRGLAATLAAWEERAHPHGTELVVSATGEATVVGKFAGLGDDGLLRLAMTDGTLQVIHAGDVALG